MARKRHLSRVAVMQTLFERHTHAIDELKTLDRNAKLLQTEVGLVDADFAHLLLKTTLDHLEIIKQKLVQYAPQWPLDRMDTMARSILLVGAAELLFLPDTPVPVVINEAIDIAKEYGGSEASKFVNGVLHTLSQNLKS